MRAINLLFLLFSPVFGTPAQVVLNVPSQSPFHHGILTQSESAALKFLSNSKKAILNGKHDMQRWWHKGKEYIKETGLLYELVSIALFPEHRMRLTEPDLCDPSVKQYSGYLDVAEDKHLFFWFFESRSSPKDDPLVLWLNGGPGCSSSTGLLFELGPCRIANSGKNTTHNPHSWTNHANIIFLDQPINVGYSYSSNGTTVNTTPLAAKDVYAFLQLFLKRFPEYSKQEFHIAAESYGGTYVPNFANLIYQENKKLVRRPRGVPPGALTRINLASVILGNGLTDPYVQMGSVADYVCGGGPYPIYDDPEGPQCQALRAKVPTCQRLVKTCYQWNTPFACFPAALYCNSQLFAPLTQLGLNLYDVRRKCDRETDGELCYVQLKWVERWMNDPEHKVALGVNPDLTFASCNQAVNRDFAFQGDGMHNSAVLLPELVNDGVRLLVYAGNADVLCNYIGNERWVEQLETQFQREFITGKAVPWLVGPSNRVAGSVRAAGGGGGRGYRAGNITFVTVFEAGHMVPYDQPEAALDLFSKWIMNLPLKTE